MVVATNPMQTSSRSHRCSGPNVWLTSCLQISEAYEVLSDSKKRSNFDQFGKDGPSVPDSSDFGGFGGNGATFHFSTRGGGQAGFRDPHEIFK